MATKRTVTTKATTSKKTGGAKAKGAGGAKSPAAKGAARPKLSSSHTARHPGAGAARPSKLKPRGAPVALRDENDDDVDLISMPTPSSPAPRAAKRARPARGTDESPATREARDRAIAIAAAGLEKKAVDTEIIDVAGRVDYADYLVLMTGNSDRHVASIVQGIEEALRKHGSRAISVEGMPAANWVLIDFADVVVHVFQESARGLYDIDGLWMDARRVPVANEGRGAPNSLSSRISDLRRKRPFATTLSRNLPRAVSPRHHRRQ